MIAKWIACWALHPDSVVKFPVRAKALSFATTSLFSDTDIKHKPTHRVIFSMEHAGAS